jgi:hypothetical protein
VWLARIYKDENAALPQGIYQRIARLASQTMATLEKQIEHQLTMMGIRIFRR